MSGSGSGSSNNNAINAGSSANNSKRKNVLAPDADRRPVLLEESFIDRLLQMASMAFPYPMNPASFALHTSIPTLHQAPPARPLFASVGESILAGEGPLSRCNSTYSIPVDDFVYPSLSADFHGSDSNVGKGSTSLGSVEPLRVGGGKLEKPGLFLSMMMGNSENSSIPPFLAGSPQVDYPSSSVPPPGSPSNRVGSGSNSASPSFSNASTTAGAVAPVLPSTQAVSGSGSLSTLPVKESSSTQEPLKAQRLAPEDYEYIALHLSSSIARSLNLEDYWTNLKSQIKVDSLVFFIFYCAHHRFTALKTLHLLEFLQGYEGLVEAGCNKEGELVAAAAEEAAARAAAAQAALADNSSHAEEVESVSTVPATGGGGGAGDVNARGGVGSADKKKSDSREKKRSKPPSKKEKLAALAAEEERKRKEEEAAELVLEAERQRQLAAERSLLSWEEMLQHTMKDFLMSELELGWRWDQFPWQSNKAGGLLSPGYTGGSSGNGAVGQGNGGAGGASAPATGGASGNAGSSSGKSGGGGNSGGGKKKGEKARLQQIQELEEEQKRLAAAAAALPRENIYLRLDEIPLFTAVFLARGLLQHASLYQYVLRHSYMEDEDRQPPILYKLATEVPMESVPPIWMATYKGVTNPYQSLQYGVPPHPSLSSHSGINITAPSLSNNNNSNTLNVEDGAGMTPALNHGGSGGSNNHLSGAQPVPNPTSGHSSGGNKSLPQSSLGGARRGGGGTNVPGGVREVQLAVAMADFYAARDTELRRLEEAHQEAVRKERERAKIAEEDRQMRLLFKNQKKSEVVENVYDSVQDCLTSRQLHILQRIEALEQQLGITKPVNIPSVLQKGTGNDNAGADTKKKAGKRKKNP